ncbi:883_t:CDS:2 [Acaulospora morrowiae]|uniref:883_t:CDS:1 n=1 Tax=Acaulospora morrowiae TaxID=94023 RepID=A0A9N9GPK4_9GLOM|nr:883_t:CDS:2 [Acaulospora morrowiae]
MDSTSTPLESLAIEGLSTLNRLLETSGEIFTSLSRYSYSNDNTEEAIRREIAESHEKYKNVSEELKVLVDNIDNIQEEKLGKIKEDNMDTYDPNSDPIIVELINTRSSLLQAYNFSHYIPTISKQAYKLQFLIQTLLASSEQEAIVPPP